MEEILLIRIEALIDKIIMFHVKHKIHAAFLSERVNLKNKLKHRQEFFIRL